MKILLVIPAIGAVYGGTTNIIVSWAKALSRQGLSLDIITTNANGSDNLDVPLQKWVSLAGYRIQYFPYVSFRDYKWSNEFSNWLFRNVCDYDLVHSSANFSLTNIPVYWACQWNKVPYIMTPHGMLEPWALSYKAWKKRWYYLLLERPALNKAKAIQATSSIEADHISDLHLKTPIFFIPNGIHDSEFQKLPDTGVFYQQFPHTRNKTLILFLGRIDPKKGLDLLAQAFRLIHPHFPKSHLVIAGQDNIGFLPMAQRYFTETECLDFVTFTGMLTGDLKYAALAAAKLYVAPSYSEGFSISILEGMASGLPCVITTGCNFPEAAVAQAAHVVEPKAEQIADALIRCLQDPEAAKTMGHRARRLILENYTWDKIAANLIEVYQAILQKAPLPQRLLPSSLRQTDR